MTPVARLHALRRLLLQIREFAHDLGRELEERTADLQDMEIAHLRQALAEVDARTADLLASIRTTSPGH